MSNLIVSVDAEGWYSFVNRGVQYDLKEEKEWGHWLVFTWRRSLPISCRGIKTLTMQEMINGNNKTLKTFAGLVEAEAKKTLN